MDTDSLLESALAVNRFTDELFLRCRNHPWFLERAQDVTDRTPAYNAAIKNLTPEQQEAIESYIAACEELEYARIFVAYTIGREHQQKGIPPFPQD